MCVDFFFSCVSCKAILQFHDTKNTIFLHVNTSTVLSTHVCLNNICHVPIRMNLHLGTGEKKSETHTQMHTQNKLDESNERMNKKKPSFLFFARMILRSFVIGIIRTHTSKSSVIAH